MTKRALNPAEKAFYRGFAVAVGTVAREFHEPAMAANIAQSNGVTLAALLAAGVETQILKSFKAELAAAEERARKKEPSRGKK